MSLRRPAGFIRPGYDPLEVPNAPTSVSASGGDTQASVSFTAPSNVGGAAITAYYAVSSPGQITTSGTASPITVTGLTNGTAYTFQVWALNSYGPSPYSAASGSVTPVQRGLFAGGFRPSASNTISYITISTTGNDTDFGDLTQTSTDGSACSSSTRGVFKIGPNLNNLEYVTIATTGNAAYFGDLVSPFQQGSAGGCSNSTRGLFAGAYSNQTQWTSIGYITIATTGDSTTFGDLTQQRGYVGGVASPTRAVFGGGTYVMSATAYPVNNIDYVTIASTGNATDFGDMSQTRDKYGACSNSTRGVFGGGFASGSAVNTIDYITIASAGNATDFGDLTVSRHSLAACSSSTRGVFGGGRTTESVNIIDYVTIATTGNATDFGDFTTVCQGPSACSNCHGGL